MATPRRSSRLRSQTPARLEIDASKKIHKKFDEEISDEDEGHGSRGGYVPIVEAAIVDTPEEGDAIEDHDDAPETISLVSAKQKIIDGDRIQKEGRKM